MALYGVLAAKKFEVVCLLTTITDQFHRVAMHGVREELLDLQANSLGYPMEKVLIPYPCPNQIYEERMRNALSTWKARGVSHAIFGTYFWKTSENIVKKNYHKQTSSRPFLFGEKTRELWLERC